MSIVDVKRLTALNRQQFLEFLRYSAVGALSFLVDAGVMILLTEMLFQNSSKRDVAVAAACGFLAGLVCNFWLSHLFVFTNQEQAARGKNIRGFVLYGLIGLVGLAMTEAGMLAGLALIGHDGFRYVLIKCVVAAIVLIWNYLARKIFVYKGA